MNPIKNKKDLEASIDEIKNFAYSYLDKYSPSKQQLRIYLFKKLIKKKKTISSRKEIFNLIDVVIQTLVDEKFLSDKYYSDAKSKVFLRRGYSINKIRYNLGAEELDGLSFFQSLCQSAGLIEKKFPFEFAYEEGTA